MNKILIVGCGVIGSRHLQSLSSTNTEIEIYAVDNNRESLNNAKSIFESMPLNDLICRVDYYDSINEINFDIDLAIIATNSDVRKRIVKEILSKIRVKYLILEKVVFQSAKCFKEVIKLIKQNNTCAWVNCPNRVFPCYRNMKDKIFNNGNLYMSVDGGNWEISGNSIHYLDLFNYLTEDIINIFNIDGLDAKLYPSKRSGFVDFNGQIYVETLGGDKLVINNNKYSDRPVTINIVNDNFRYIIFEDSGKAIIQNSFSKWEKKEIEFSIIPQSKITSIISDEILNFGCCDLITLEQSFVLHKTMLEAFTGYLNKINNDNLEKCPIT